MELAYICEIKRPLVFIHGSGSSKKVWRYHISQIGGYAIDLPGHGESLDDTTIKSVEDYAKHVVRFIKNHMEKAYVIGHSLGGAIAQQIYLLDKKIVKGVVLVGSGARLRVLPEILYGLKNDFKNTAKKLITYLFSRGFSDKKVKESVLKEILKCGSRVCHRDFSVCDKFDLLEKYKNRELTIDVPMLCIVGNEDVLTPPKYAYFYKEITDAKVEVINGAGHMVMLEQKEEVNRVLDKFCI